MIFACPVTEQRFLLRHIAAVDDLIGSDRFETLDTDVIEAIIHGSAEFAEGEFAPLLRIGDDPGPRWTQGKVVMPDGFREAYAAFIESGWGTIASPSAYGGQGLPFSLATLVLENLSAANLGFAACPTLTAGAIEAIEAHGSTDQKSRWLPKLISGEWSGTMNLTEPQAGSDVGALRTVAEPTENGLYRIKGQKIFISFGEHDLAANIVHLVLARLPDAPPGSKGISLFLVPRQRLDADGNPGPANDVRCASIEHKLGLHASPTCIMVYGDNDECLGELLGSENGGLRAMFTMMNNARINVGNQGIQVAERARQLALAYARDRIQSPRADRSSGLEPVAIIGHPDVRRMILRMNALTQAARALLYYASGQLDRAHLGDAQALVRAELMTPLVKAYGSDVGCEVAALGVQVHGGMGFIEETGAAQHYRDARIMPIYEGTNGIQAADLVGRKLVGDKGMGLASLLAEIRADVGTAPTIMALAQAVERVAQWMIAAPINDRLAGSYPFMQMTSVLTAAWLMARQEALLDADADPPDFAAGKRAAVRFYLTCIVPEATGLGAAAQSGAALLYDITDEALTA
ncbi:acyl-CoA dehydrogenase [Sphingobium sp. CR2-8]|uniref:acyl-CoA dehydrogenase n=1 Tax=Sphingobium sp. CR2-8 TaxID=1306534 RepID=UPI002DB754B5|nr:acyl-CoA dehydrogenase [Sphingobium sp. CR2-8]MEC3909534.1 acyl-CoA dehydrogenase [Sphingobium sp. CR2-8]